MTDELKRVDAWEEKKEKLKRQYPNITEADLEFVEGNDEPVIRKLQDKLGKSRREIVEIVRNL